MKWIFREVNSTQLGMDLAWDLFISAGTILLAISMWNHPVYRKIFSFTGIIVSVLLFGFNMYSFPVPPTEAGSIDFGPLMAFWYFTLTIWTWVKRKNFSEK